MKPRGILKNSTREVTVKTRIRKSVILSSVKTVARQTDIPGLVVHRDLDEVGQPTGEGWTITHEVSGLAARFGIANIHMLRRVLEGIAEFDVDWTKPESAVGTKENAKRFMAVLESAETTP